MTEHALMAPGLRALLDAECAAEAAARSGADAEDLRQGVWLRWLEQLRRTGPPTEPAAWLAAAVWAEARAAADAGEGREVPRGAEPAPRTPPQSRITAADGHGDPASDTEAPLLAIERRRELVAAVSGLPGRCPAVLRALLSRKDPTYPQIAHELGISQGAVGPLRSRCLECLRRMLAAKVPPPGSKGRVREATGVTRADCTDTAPSLSRARAHTTWGGMRTWA
ncbi:sigma-70 family RNA polymerase sigma factor [Streptomyces oryzae]|uniref:Sigma-70 family RNA polymerase sigma factor n=1 Tax=Streptomyces oryzae TaxID=1434886 RepID=A0ABS3X5Y3_9ACTN|nr:sigma-70 family RNA polymerase sigma factor [Streptomyces oryzae]MBO8190734.1 sigma-70 family RNA polymerase sigma factor [Streptomyces oryzae]